MFEMKMKKMKLIGFILLVTCLMIPVAFSATGTDGYDALEQFRQNNPKPLQKSIDTFDYTKTVQTLRNYLATLSQDQKIEYNKIIDQREQNQLSKTIPALYKMEIEEIRQIQAVDRMKIGAQERLAYYALCQENCQAMTVSLEKARISLVAAFKKMSVSEQNEWWEGQDKRDCFLCSNN